jgi:glycosyltransferase involved in cell wall biosynthesis
LAINLRIKGEYYMLVCHIWPIFFPFDVAGVERYVLNLSDFLSQQDQSMRFLLLTDRSNVNFWKASLILKSERINSLEVHRLGPNLSSLFVKASYKLFQRRSKKLEDLMTMNLYKEAINIRGINKVDIFHVHGFWQPVFPTLGMMLSQHFHRPLVITLHGDSIDINDPYSMPIRSATTINVLKHADVITTYSRETLKVLEKLGLGKKCMLIPNFVEVRLFSRPVASNIGSGNRVVMVSRLSQGKDPITPIRAFAKVKKEVPDASLEIVGYGPLHEYATELIQELNLSGSVKLVGKKSDVRPYLWNNDIFIGTRGSYIATLEAWAAGLAVIAPNVGIMKEVISNGENGLLVAPGNIDGLASAMLSLMKNKDLRTTIISNSAQALKKHDISWIAPSIADIYKSLQSKFTSV